MIVELNTDDIVITMLTGGHFNPPFDQKEIDYLRINFDIKGFNSVITFNEREIGEIKNILKEKIIRKLSRKGVEIIK